MPEEKTPIITLTTDFGGREHYVASMKGAILEVAPKARIIDITHDVNAFDVLEAAYAIRCAYEAFPARTIHVVVVDPGVGTARRPILVSTEKYYFVAPDNGVLSFIYDREPVTRVVHVTAEHYRRTDIAPTFHGRDLFGPSAGWLAKGIDPTNFGEEITDYRRMEVPKGKAGDGSLQGMVLHVDRFGNIITSIHRSEVEAMLATTGPVPMRIRIGEREITQMRETYMEGPADEVFGVYGSTGYLEIAVARKSAAAMLGARRTEKVLVSFG